MSNTDEGPYTGERLPDSERPEDDQPQSLAPQPAARPRSVAWLLAVLAVILLAALGGVGKLWMDRAAAVEALDTAVTVLPQRLGQPETVKAVQRQLQLITQDARAGRFGATKERLINLRPPAVPPAAEKAGKISPQAQAFLEKHPDLLNRLLHYAELARALKEQGVDVQPLRDIRDAVLQAADDQNVVDLNARLDEFARLLIEAGAKPEQVAASEMSASLREKLQKIEQLFREAVKEGRDVEAAGKLMRKLEEAVKAGEVQKASSLADEVLSKLKHAPRARRQVAKGPQSGSLPPPTVAQKLLMAFFSLVQVEDRDLARIQETLDNARLALRENNGQQVTEILDRGAEVMKNMWRRRHEFSDSIRKAMAPQGGQRKPAEQDQSSPQQPAAQGPLGRLADFLSRVRSLSDEEFEQHKLELARELMIATIPRRPPPQVVEELKKKLPADRAQEALAAAANARVRAKLEIAAEPYMLLKRQGADTTGLDTLFAQTRQALYRKDYDTAERLVNEALARLGLQPPTETASEGNAKPSAEPAAGSSTSAGPAPSSNQTSDQAGGNQQ